MSLATEIGRIADRLHDVRAAVNLHRAIRLDGPTLVLGSAPLPELPARWDRASPLVTVNASQASAESLGLPEPHLTVLSVTLLGDLESNREAQRALAGRRTRHLLVVSHAYEWQRDHHVLDDIGYRAESLSRVSTRHRAHVVRTQTGLEAGRGDPISTKVSNGVYAICQALALGAPQVVVAGFSLSPGHAYNSLGHPRLHLAPDRRAFAALAARGDGRVRAATPALAEVLGLPAWTGEG